MNKQDSNRQNQQNQQNQPQGQGGSGKMGSDDGARYGKEPQDQMRASGDSSKGPQARTPDGSPHRPHGEKAQQRDRKQAAGRAANADQSAAQNQSGEAATYSRWRCSCELPRGRPQPDARGFLTRAPG